MAASRTDIKCFSEYKTRNMYHTRKISRSIYMNVFSPFFSHRKALVVSVSSFSWHTACPWLSLFSWWCQRPKERRCCRSWRSSTAWTTVGKRGSRPYLRITAPWWLLLDFNNELSSPYFVLGLFCSYFKITTFLSCLWPCFCDLQHGLYPFFFSFWRIFVATFEGERHKGH